MISCCYCRWIYHIIFKFICYFVICFCFFFLMIRRPPRSTRTDTLFPYTTLFRSQRAGVDILHVPYKGGSPALVDVVGGRVGAYYSTPSSAAPHIATGKVIALATTGQERTADMPDIPTIAESGRSEERSAGKACASTCSSGWSPSH